MENKIISPYGAHEFWQTEQGQELTNYISETNSDYQLCYNAYFSRAAYKKEWDDNTLAYEGKLWSVISSEQEIPDNIPSDAFIDTQVIYNGVRQKMTSFINQSFHLKAIPIQNLLSNQNTQKADFETEVSQLGQVINTSIKEHVNSPIHASMISRAIVTGSSCLLFNYESQGMINLNNTDVIKSNRISYQYVDINNVYFSPIAQDLESADYYFIVTRTTTDYVKKIYDVDLKEELNKINDKYMRDQSSQGLLNDRFLDLDITKSLLYINEAEIIDYNNNLVDMIIKFEKVLDKKTNKTKIRVRYYGGWCFLKEVILDMDFYPMEILYYEKHPQIIYGRTCVTKALSSAKTAMKALTNYSIQSNRYNNPVSLLLKSSGISAEEYAASRQFGGVLVVDDSRMSPEAINKGIVQIVPAAEPTQALLETVKLNIQSCEKILGINDITNANASVSGSKTGAVDSLIDQAYRSDEVFSNEYENFIKRLASKVARLILNNADKKTQFLTTDFDSNSNIHGDYITFESDAIRKHDYKFDFDVQPTSREKSNQDFNKVLQMLQLGAQLYPNQQLFTPQELMKYANLRDGHQIIERLTEDNSVIKNAKINEIVMLIAKFSNLNDQVIRAGQQPLDVSIVHNMINSILSTEVPLQEAIDTAQQQLNQMMQQITQSQQQNPQGGQS